ncbi:MAG TPA: hypothetical protein VM802_18055 [Chitinophaga sp.]|uniref:TlpA family protein disulfide reductase n=1 Tax=Chitinophaga sp. TaxID=1869181 RepID=UPI002BA300E7|nr:hypothetical protein [Chitinophaga sp.]HVI46788.1 hypothetical protein [Chitinophaga sp.]
MLIVSLGICGTSFPQSILLLAGHVQDHHGGSISFSSWEEPGISPAVTRDVVLQKDSFYIEMPAVAGRRIFFYADAGGENNFYGMLHGGDNVQLFFGADTLVFSGKGAVSCSAQYLAEKAQRNIPAPAGNDAALRVAWYKKQLAAATAILNVYRDSLTTADYTIIRANVLGETAGKLIDCMWRLRADSILAERQAAFYRNHILQDLPHIEISDTTATAIRYLRYLLRKAEADYFSQYHRQCSDRDIYEWIKGHYTGVLRDKLLAHQLLQGLAAGGPQDELAVCARDYLSLVQHPGCKQAIAATYGNIRRGLSRGAVAPVFSLPDNTGHQVSLGQFAGKVVLLHFCNTDDPLLSSLSEINKCFKKDEVVFLHISCNDAGITDYPGVHLYAGSQLQQVREQYNINRYPALIIVGRDGKIYAVRPPDPVADYGAALANIIYAALLQ